MHNVLRTPPFEEFGEIRGIKISNTTTAISCKVNDKSIHKYPTNLARQEQ
jgi:hypothetical protein